MKIKSEFILIVIFGIIFFSGCEEKSTDPNEKPKFTLNDLQGSWEYVGLISGDAPSEKPGWYFGDMIIDDRGNPTTSTPIRDSQGNDYYVPNAQFSYAISNDGIITVDPDPGAQIRGVMNSSKNMIMSTATMAPGNINDVKGYNLIISVKIESAFNQSDLMGTWECVGLISGDAPSETPGWYYGKWTIDMDGVLSTSTPVTDSNGNNTWIPTSQETLFVSNDGIISADPQSNVQFRGVMNSSKDIIVSTVTMAPGNINSVKGFNLLIWIKSGQSYSQSDLAGLWEYTGLISGDSPNETPGWYYGNWLIDSQGSSSTTTPLIDSNGNSTILTGDNSTLVLSSDGIITADPDPGVQLRGIMNFSKNMIISSATMAPGPSSGVKGFNLTIWTMK